MSTGMSARTTRANGRASRRQILEAASEIAGECGYQGTSISAVSERSGLPKSSIYWHFRNKDDLLAAVINDSYEQWREELGEPHRSTEDGASTFERMYASLGKFPDFIRLGLLLTLEPAPEGEQAARNRFLQIRQDSLRNLRSVLMVEYPSLDTTQAEALAAMALALIDGSFVAAIAGETSQTPKLLSDAIDTLAKTMGRDGNSGGSGV